MATSGRAGALKELALGIPEWSVTASRPQMPSLSSNCEGSSIRDFATVSNDRGHTAFSSSSSSSSSNGKLSVLVAGVAVKLCSIPRRLWC